ncbi:MAG: DUF815 domain-containing protein [Thermoleophilia bacterium]|nr:DUF815 domain-containing protein [Thermoleophilia bacterium]
MTERIAYADLDGHPLVRALADVHRHAGDPAAAAELARAVFGLETSVPEAVARLVLGSEGPFARLARGGLAAGDRRLARAAAELEDLGELAHADIGTALARHGLEATAPEGDGHTADAPPAVRELTAALGGAAGWGDRAAPVAAFHAAEGTGALATHRVLRFAAHRLTGIDHPDPVAPGDLIGGEARRAPLRDALERFAAGRPANDALVYGPPGTGKSATVRALAAGLAHTGLRLVQVDRADAGVIGALFAGLAGDGPRCLVLLDDLVFDDQARTDRALRAALEGDAAGRPANVLVWATSNRLKLLRETHSEREDDMDEALGRGEKAALATRFGLRVPFPGLGQDEYLEVAMGLVERLGGRREGAPAAALRFARQGHGMSPRTARQFAIDWAGRP